MRVPSRRGDAVRRPAVATVTQCLRITANRSEIIAKLVSRRRLVGNDRHGVFDDAIVRARLVFGVAFQLYVRRMCMVLHYFLSEVEELRSRLNLRQFSNCSFVFLVGVQL